MSTKRSESGYLEILSLHKALSLPQYIFCSMRLYYITLLLEISRIKTVNSFEEGDIEEIRVNKLTIEPDEMKTVQLQTQRWENKVLTCTCNISNG